MQDHSKWRWAALMLPAIMAAAPGEVLRASPQQAGSDDGNCMKELRSAALAGNPEAPLAGGCQGVLPIHYAAMRLDGASIMRLIAAGADIEATDSSGLTPLHYAARERKLTTLRSLLESGASPSPLDAILKRTPLHYAVDDSRSSVVARHYGVSDPPATDRFEVIEALLGAGAAVNAFDAAGETPLHLAAAAADAAAVRLLLSSGADPNARNRSGGDPPLFYAILHGNQAAERELRQRGADPDALDLQGVKVTEKALEFAPILDRFHSRNKRIIEDASLSPAERASEMAKRAQDLGRTLEDRYNALKARAR